VPYSPTGYVPPFNAKELEAAEGQPRSAMATAKPGNRITSGETRRSETFYYSNRVEGSGERS